MSNAVYTEIANSVLPSQDGTVGQRIRQTVLDSTQDGLTAGAGGGTGNAVKLTAKKTRITTVATANDSVILPPSLAGLTLVINNNSANNAAVFPAQNGDAINAGANNASYLQATGTTTYTCYTTGKWITS